MPSSAGLRDRSHNPAGVQMEHVPGAPRQSPAHQQCLTGEIHTGQQTVRAEPVAERLLVQSQRDRSRHELSYFIAGPRIQVQVAPATSRYKRRRRRSPSFSAGLMIGERWKEESADRQFR